MQHERLPCPVDGCRSKRKSETAFCQNHWFSLPLRMRQEIWQTARAVRQSGGIEETAERYREAVVAARDYLNHGDANPRIPEAL